MFDERENKCNIHECNKKQMKGSRYCKDHSNTQKDVSLTGVDSVSQSMLDSTSENFEKGDRETPTARPLINEERSNRNEYEIKLRDREDKRRQKEKEVDNSQWHRDDPNREPTEKQVQHVNVDSTELDTDEAARLERAKKKRAAQAGEEYKSTSGIDLRKIAAMERILEKGNDPRVQISRTDWKKFHSAGRARAGGSTGYQVKSNVDNSWIDVRIEHSAEEGAEKLSQSGLTLEKVQTMEEILKAAEEGDKRPYIKRKDVINFNIPDNWAKEHPDLVESIKRERVARPQLYRSARYGLLQSRKNTQEKSFQSDFEKTTAEMELENMESALEHAKRARADQRYKGSSADLVAYERKIRAKRNQLRHADRDDAGFKLSQSDFEKVRLSVSTIAERIEKAHDSDTRDKEVKEAEREQRFKTKKWRKPFTVDELGRDKSTQIDIEKANSNDPAVRAEQLALHMKERRALERRKKKSESYSPPNAEERARQQELFRDQ